MKTLGFSIILIVLGHVASVHGETFYENGVSCRRSASSSAIPEEKVRYSIAGSYNNAGSAVSVKCPVNWRDANTTPVMSDTTVYYMDAATSAVSCVMMAIQSDGTAWVGSTRFSCSTPGGCLHDTSPTYTTGALDNYLTLPAVNPALVHIGGYYMQCTLPAAAQGIIRGYKTPVI